MKSLRLIKHRSMNAWWAVQMYLTTAVDVEVNGQPRALVGLLRCSGKKDYFCLESNTRPTNSSVTVVTE